MKDKNGVEIKTGDILFYSEMPYSNYADSLIHIHEVNNIQTVETLVVNGLSCTEYVESGGDSLNDLQLSVYGWNVLGEQTNECLNVEVLPDVDKSMVSIELANSMFPLDRLITPTNKE